MSVLHTENYEGHELVIGRETIQYRGVRIKYTQEPFTELKSARTAVVTHRGARIFRLVTENTFGAMFSIRKDEHSGYIVLYLVEGMKYVPNELNETVVEIE